MVDLTFVTIVIALRTKMTMLNEVMRRQKAVRASDDEVFFHRLARKNREKKLATNEIPLGMLVHGRKEGGHAFSHQTEWRTQ